MSIEANKALVRRFADEVMCSTNLAAIDKLVAPDALHHEGDWTTNYRAILRRVFGDMIDPHFAIEELIAEGDLVVARGTFTATAGPAGDTFHGLPITAHGARASAPHAHFFRIRDGQIVDHWPVRDHLATARELGALPDQHAVSQKID